MSLWPRLCHRTGQSTAEQDYIGLGIFEAGLSRDTPEQRTPYCKRGFIAAIFTCTSVCQSVSIFSSFMFNLAVALTSSVAALTPPERDEVKTESFSAFCPKTS